jgi:hypothetical protein
MMFKDIKGKKKQLPSQYFCKEKKSTKNIKALFFGRGFSVFMGGLRI